MFCWEPRAGYADYYERALYNSILSSQENARLLITGFGSFGGTSLVRGVTAKLMDNFARRQQGKVLVIRLETLRGAPEGHYRLFVNENQAGAGHARSEDR